MSPLLPVMPALPCWLVVVALLAGGAAEQPLPSTSATWPDLLQAALDRTADDKVFIEEVASQQPDDPLGQLAKVLLEEWELRPRAEVLQQPRVIVAPKPNYSDLAGQDGRLKSAVVAASGEVTPAGTVEKIEVKISSGVEEIDERCAEAFAGWRYRPARSEHGYVRSMVAVTCHVHPRG